MVAAELTGMIKATIYVLIFDLCASCIHGLFRWKTTLYWEEIPLASCHWWLKHCKYYCWCGGQYCEEMHFCRSMSHIDASMISAEALILNGPVWNDRISVSFGLCMSQCGLSGHKGSKALQRAITQKLHLHTGDAKNDLWCIIQWQIFGSSMNVI